MLTVEQVQEAMRLPGFHWEPGMNTQLPTLKYFGHRLSRNENPHGEYDWPHDLGLRIVDAYDERTGYILLSMLRHRYILNVMREDRQPMLRWRDEFGRMSGTPASQTMGEAVIRCVLLRGEW